ncbi:hypothetical protein M085_4224, partial [Bacteroides fragilis str. 3986 N(B)19]
RVSFVSSKCLLRREQIETEKGKRAFVDGLSILTPGDMKALSGGK